MTVSNIIKERILDNIELVGTKIFDIQRLEQRIRDNLDRIPRDSQLSGSPYVSCVNTASPPPYNRFCSGLHIEIYIRWYEKVGNELISSELIKNANGYSLRTLSVRDKKSNPQTTRTEVLGVLF